MMTRSEFERYNGIRTDGQVQQGPVNLDGMTTDELAHAQKHPALHSDVRAYARCKRSAMLQRMAGNVADATGLETRCERLYGIIPKSLRW